MVLRKFPEYYQKFINDPVPSQMQQIYTFAWLLSPLLVIMFGSFSLDSQNKFCFFPGAPYFHRVLQCDLVKDGDAKDSKKQDLKTIRDWVMRMAPTDNQSSHFWYSQLPENIKDAFHACAEAPQISGMFRRLFSEQNYCMDIVTGMNEIYVTGPPRADQTSNSDQVFYTRHVDGPWGFIPFVSVYRCILGMDKNLMITTHFPLANLAVNACEGELIAFDFNREVHYITSDESKRALSDKFRVTLKLHYCVYPRVLAPLGWLMHFLNVRYNELFRVLFLKTINPTSLYEHFLAWNVNSNTVFFESIENFFGMRNILYVLFAASLWWATNTYEVFLVMTSYVHYIRYISTYYIRRGIDFGIFKRDVLLFKTLALIQLFYHYFFPRGQSFVFDPVSALLIVVGYTVSVMATNALGLDRTYFAAELGLVDPKWITQFPYGYIPHPMIVSQIVAMLGFFKAEHFRSQWPYVVPGHIALYTLHMLQEHFNIYRHYSDNDAVEPAVESVAVPVIPHAVAVSAAQKPTWRESSKSLSSKTLSSKAGRSNTPSKSRSTTPSKRSSTLSKSGRSATPGKRSSSSRSK